MSWKEASKGILFRDIALGPLGNAAYNKIKGRSVSTKEALLGQTATKYLAKKPSTPKPIQSLFNPIQAPTEYSSDVVAAGRDARRRAGNRRGYMAAIGAGETNSNAAYSSSAGVRSLIGIP